MHYRYDTGGSGTNHSKKTVSKLTTCLALLGWLVLLGAAFGFIHWYQVVLGVK